MGMHAPPDECKSAQSTRVPGSESKKGAKDRELKAFMLSHEFSGETTFSENGLPGRLSLQISSPSRLHGTK